MNFAVRVFHQSFHRGGPDQAVFSSQASTMFKWGRRNLTSGATIHEISYGVCLKIGSPMVLPKLMDSHHIAP